MTPGSTAPRLLSGSRSACEAELVGRVTAWRSDDPLGPITVLVPNLATGERVAELVTAGGAAVVGLEVRTLEDLARAVLERTGAAGGLGLPPGARQLLVRGLLAGPEAPPELAALSDRPGLLSAVGAGLRDLVDANVGELDAGERAAAGPLGTLHGAHLGRRLELDVDDDSSRFVRALERAAEAPFRRLLVHGIYDPTGLQERFLAACLAVAGEAVMLVPAHGRALAERLAGPGCAVDALADLEGSTAPIPEVHSLPGGLAGARLLARHLRDLLAEGDLAPADLLCVSRGTGGIPQAELAVELERLGVPAERTRSLAERPPGPFLLGLGRLLARSRVSRVEFLDTLALAPGLEPGRLAHWDRLTRDADLRLLVGTDGASPAARGRLLWQGKRLEGAEDPTGQARRHALEGLLALLDGFGRLHRDLRAGETWATIGRRLGALLEDHGLLVPATEVEDPWRRHLETLGGLDHLGLPADPLGLVASLTELGARPDPSAARDRGPGGAVTLAALGRSRGGRWRHVVLLDGDEGSFPRRAPVDPLLGDEGRLRLARRAPTLTRDAAADERALIAELLALSSEGLILCTTRGGLEGKAPQGPSRFVLELLTELRGGRAPGLEDLAKGKVEEVTFHGLAGLWTGGVPGPAGPRCAEDAALALTTAGFEPAALRRLVAAELPAEAARASMELARADRPGASPFDGDLAGTAAQGELVDSGALRGRGRNLSASTLEAYAGCGMRSLLQRWLGLAEHEEPEAQRGLDARERGKAVHDILEAFGKDTKQAGLVPWSAADRGRLAELLARSVATTLERIRRAAAPEDRALWDAEEPRYEGLLGRWLDRRLADPGWSPEAFEWAFEDHAYELPEGEPLLLGGRVDRVDLATDDSGRVRVVDYKTGGTGDAKDDSTGGGRRLQAHLYGRAARRAFGAHASVGLYDHVLVGSEVAWSGAERSFGKDDGRRVEGDAAAVREVTALVAGMEAGHFEPLPRKERKLDPKACEFCPMVEACGPWRTTVFEARDDGGPVLAELDEAVRPRDAEHGEAGP